MSWDTEPQEDRDLVERGAAVFQSVALAVALGCVIGALSAFAMWWGAR